MDDTARAAIRAGLTPMLWGAPGCGKSAWAASSGRPTVVIQGAAVAAEDVAGYPVPRGAGGGVDMLPPTWAMPEPGGVLVIDDLPDADAAVQRALYGLVLSRRLGVHPLPPGCAVIATGNPPKSSSRGCDLPPALTDRLIHVACAVDLDRAVHGIWPEPPPVVAPPADTDVAQWRARLGGFRRAHHAGEPQPGTHGQTPSQRSWEHAAVLMAAGLDTLAALTATVGEAAAAQCARWLRDADLPAPEALVADHGLTPARPESQYAAFGALAAWAAGGPADRRRAAWGVLTCGRADRAVLTALVPALRRLTPIPTAARKYLEGL